MACCSDRKEIFAKEFTIADGIEFPSAFSNPQSKTSSLQYTHHWSVSSHIYIPVVSQLGAFETADPVASHACKAAA